MYFLDRIKLNVIGHKYLWLSISGVLLLIGLSFLVTVGLKPGIDFTGGTILQRTFEEKVSVAQVRTALSKPPLSELGLAGEASIQAGAGGTIIVRTKPLSPEREKQFDAGLEQLVGKIDRDKSSTDTVGPVIGRELLSKAIWSIILASVGILIYVAFRFEFKFAVAGVLALLHDVLMTMGLFAIFGKFMGLEVNSPFVAAMLTIVGYSINDTIVIFDRIRENLRFRKKESFAEIVDKSINQTLARSINTVATVLVTVIALHFWGGASLRDFTLALLIGITSGAYSSIFIASPLWVIFKGSEQKKALAAKTAR
ncbi:MAG: protein translocase subunit SecF [Firmicutes bacterium]|nr:protein translocase subunit SecF [Bacillota bacterium]